MNANCIFVHTGVKGRAAGAPKVGAKLAVVRDLFGGRRWMNTASQHRSLHMGEKGTPIDESAAAGFADRQFRRARCLGELFTLSCWQVCSTAC